jgi:hypothetical protein
MIEFLAVKDLNIGSIDAVNYTSRQDKEFLNRIFLKDNFLERLLESKRYFLVGEKGTGKTAYAAFLTSNQYKNTRSQITGMTSTDYSKFIKIKQLGHLQISDYVDTWRVILLMLISQHVKTAEPIRILQFGKFTDVQTAIDQYYKSAFVPEIVNAIEFVEHAEQSAAIIAKVAKIGVKHSASATEKGTGFQTSLMFVEKAFKDAIGSLKLEQNHIIFIDGIDVRPSSVEFETYIECIRGLALAAWNLNSDFLSNIRDSRGRIKIVVLLRPDIFNAITFHNANGKLRDNSVVLDWQTEYRDYRTSRIFKLIDRTLSKQEKQPDDLELGAAWDHYFPYELGNMRIAEQKDNPFIGFLRTSFYRPRDIISYLDIMRSYVAQHEEAALTFSNDIYIRCQSDYSEYLLAEVKDHLAFYYSEADFEELIGFFKFLQGKMRFDWEQFRHAYTRSRESNKHRALTIKALTDGPEAFLQFLYSLNVIGYNEKTDDKMANFVHWSFRDRTATILNPKIPPGLGSAGESPYTVHPGLARALKVGQSG